MNKNQTEVLILLALLYASGISYAIGQQVAYNIGAAEPSSLIYVLPMYAGSVLLLLFPQKGQSPVRSLLKRWRPVMTVIASLDVLAVTCGTVGLMLAGAGIASVLQSSSVVMAAILSVIFLGTKLKFLQWVAILVVFAGLATSSIQPSQPVDPLQPAKPTGASSNLFLGVAISLLCALFAACEGITVQATLTPKPAPARMPPKAQEPESDLSPPPYPSSSSIARRHTASPDPLLPPSTKASQSAAPLSSIDLCVMTGLQALAMISVFYLVYTIPRWNELIASRIKVPGYQVAALYAFLTVAATVMNAAYFAALEKLGAVTTGLIGATRAALLFLVSAALFCSSDSSQCLTITKSAAVVIIIGGVLLFSLAGRSTAPEVDDKE